MAFKGAIRVGRTYGKILGWKKFAYREVIEVDDSRPLAMITWLRNGQRVYTKDGILLWNKSREDVFRAWVDF